MTKEEIIRQYTTIGVAQPNIKALMRELNLNEDKFYEFMLGQTCGLIGNTQVYYVHDILRFANGQKCID